MAVLLIASAGLSLAWYWFSHQSEISCYFAATPQSGYELIKLEDSGFLNVTGTKYCFVGAPELVDEFIKVPAKYGAVAGPGTFPMRRTKLIRLRNKAAFFQISTEYVSLPSDK